MSISHHKRKNLHENEVHFPGVYVWYTNMVAPFLCFRTTILPLWMTKTAVQLKSLNFFEKFFFFQIGNLKKQERKINDTHKASHCLVESSFFLCHSKNNSHFHYHTRSLQNLFSLILQFFPCTQFFHHLKVFENLILLKHLERPFYCWLCLVTWPLREWKWGCRWFCFDRNLISFLM